MERRLFANSIVALLICLSCSLGEAQNVKPQGSGDPYFSSNQGATQSPGFPRISENTLQPRIPQGGSAPSAGQGLQSRSQLSPQSFNNNSNSNLFSNDPNGGFRPRNQAPRDVSLPSNGNRNVAPLDRSGRIGPQDANAMSFPGQPRGQTTQNTVGNRPVFQERQSQGNLRFQQSPEFFESSQQQPQRDSVRLPGESNNPLSPRTPTDPRQNFANASTSGTQMLTSTPKPQQENATEFEPGRVVAIVGGHPIFVGDMLFEVNQLMDRVMPGAPAKVKNSQRGLVIKRMIPKFIDAKLLLIDTLQGLPENADFDTIVQSAEKDFDEKVLPTLLEKSNVNSSIEMDAKLRAQGGSLRQLRYKWAEEQLIKYFIGQKLNVDTEVTHQEMLEDYQGNREQYHKKSRVRWEELSIRFDKVPNRIEAEQLLKKMGNEVVYGAPFDAVARRSSQGFTASEGGKHDWTSLGSLVYKDVERALFSIPVNELSDVIPSQDGFHIVRVLERTEESYTPFLEAQVEIRAKLENQKRAMAFEDHLKKLRRRIPFEVQLDDVELPEHLADGSGSGSNFK